jgi:DNA-binding XRE family transcriptional regulator
VCFKRKPIIILILEDGMKKRKLTGFGIEVKDRLTDINMTQKKLAEEIGLSPVYLSMILYGERSGEKYLDEIKAFLKL